MVVKNMARINPKVDFALKKLFGSEENKIPDELAQDEAIKKAIETLDVMYLDSEEREMYENELKRSRDYVAEMKTAQIKGIEQGIHQGIQQGIQKGIQQGIEQGENRKAVEIVKNLLDILDDEMISLKTGLSLEEIKNLRK